MKFKQPRNIPKRDLLAFWELIDDSYRIEQMYSETKNVLITLIDRSNTYRLIYFESKDGEGIRLLNSKGYYLAVAWRKRNNTIGGIAEGHINKKLFSVCLDAFERAINTGKVELVVEKSSIPPSLHIPLTERESKFMKLFESGMHIKEIQETLSLKKYSLRTIKKSLINKGINSVEEKYGHLDEEEYEYLNTH